MEKIPVTLPPNIWLFSLLVAGTLAIGLLRWTYNQQFQLVLRSSWRFSVHDRVDIKFNIFNVTLEVWAILAIATSVLLIQKHELVFSDWAVLARYALGFGIFLTLQGTIYQLAGILLNDQTAYNAAWQEKAQFLRSSAIWFTPFLWWISFASGPQSLVSWIGGTTLIILYLWSLTRLVLVLFNSSYLRSYHNLLYLCALEICPVLIFILLM